MYITTDLGLDLDTVRRGTVRGKLDNSFLMTCNTFTFDLYFKEDSGETPQLTLEVPSDSESSAVNLDREQRQKREGRHARSQSRSPGLRYHLRSSRTGRRASHAADFLSASIARSEDAFVRPKSRLRSLGDLENEVRKLEISILIV